MRLWRHRVDGVHGVYCVGASVAEDETDAGRERLRGREGNNSGLRTARWGVEIELEP